MRTLILAGAFLAGTALGGLAPAIAGQGNTERRHLIIVAGTAGKLGKAVQVQEPF